LHACLPKIEIQNLNIGELKAMLETTVGHDPASYVVCSFCQKTELKNIVTQDTSDRISHFLALFFLNNPPNI
jgi:hypothetical protein